MLIHSLAGFLVTLEREWESLFDSVRTDLLEQKKRHARTRTQRQELATSDPGRFSGETAGIEVFRLRYKINTHFQCITKNSPNHRSHEVQRKTARRDGFRAFRAREGEWPARLTPENNGKIRQLRGKRKSPHRTVAERQGFEPWRRFPAYTRSRRAPSTTRPPLHRRVFIPTLPAGARGDGRKIIARCCWRKGGGERAPAPPGPACARPALRHGLACPCH